ncbi:MAG TPA: family 20 glycosylhydrolase [Ktedonobacteraceae bacterium]|nr:family 20 glycosylhydrolase [Ktedonobacteraceae bacterium]
MKKRTIILSMIALLSIGMIFTFLFPLRILYPTVLFANAAPEVIPALREWQGGSGSFMIDSASRITIDPTYAAQLQGTAQVFQSDLLSVTSSTLPVVTTSSPNIGDFYLTLKNPDQGIGNEGYLLKVGDSVVISASTSTGVFYGTRTILQMLIQDPAKTHIVRGTARDYPRYPERGFMLDVGRKFFSLKFLEDYVKLMAWYKMNDFHLHLNDNEIDGGKSPDWMHKYAAFRLNSPRFKGLAANDGSYTKQDMRELQVIAKQYAVTITPEIDAPAHDLAFTQYRPDLASPTDSKEFLDLTNPKTYTFLNSIWDEFLPWFDSRQVDIGADEYTTTNANQYRQFINTYDAYLKKKGKSVRMWGTLSWMTGSVVVNNDIVTDVWDNRWANPIATVHQGFQVINANDNILYIVPKAGYFNDFLDTRLLYEQWEPNIFSFYHPNFDLSPNDPHLLGAMFAEWNDKLGKVVSDADVDARVKPAMQVLSDKMWSGPTTNLSYDQFQQLASIIGTAPGMHLP